MAEFLLEILCEEIPARFQAPAAADLLRLLTEALAHVGIGRSLSFSTPRRIGCVLHDLPAATPEKTTETRGPRVGAPEAAVAGFLRACGLDSTEQCETRETEKGRFYFAVRREAARPIAAELARAVPECLDRLVWPKSMRWAGYDARWVRPVHGILAVLSGPSGSEIVPMQWRLDRLGEGKDSIEAGNRTLGHRWLSSGSIQISDFADYQAKLDVAHVLLEYGPTGEPGRKSRMADAIEACAAAADLRLHADPGLLDEAAGLVEWPVVRLGRIEPRFMALPPELLTTSMRTHQKYFACMQADGSLAPNFIVVANNEPADGGRLMVAGYERVLRARLSDAAFFWQQDRAATLESRLPKLAERVFHAKLGSVRDKVERMVALVDHLVVALPGIDANSARRALLLCKADLSSALVGEFPELQGVMGRYLALNDGESPAVADAIEQHYWPAGAAGPVPTELVSIVATLADKIDTLAGFFAIGEPPTGSKDPYALRRAALGIIRIVLDNRLRLPLRPVFEAALDHLHVTVKPGSLDALIEFIGDRLKVALRVSGVRHDLIAAVFASGEDDVTRLQARAEELAEFLGTEDGAVLLAAYRRASRIVEIEEERDKQRYAGNPNLALFGPEEQALAEHLAQVRRFLGFALEDDRFEKASHALRLLRQSVDSFFENVTVNVEDQALRKNRLLLLSQIRDTFDEIADFSKIEG